MAEGSIKSLGNFVGVAGGKRQTIIGAWRMLNVGGSQNIAEVVPKKAGFILLNDGQLDGIEFTGGSGHKSLEQLWAADQIGN